MAGCEFGNGRTPPVVVLPVAAPSGPSSILINANDDTTTVYERSKTDDPEALKLGPIVASFERPVTSYTVHATGGSGQLTFTWLKTHLAGSPCGVFKVPVQVTSGPDSTVAWSHPDKDYAPPGDCPNEAVHPATIAVKVVDALGTIVRGVYICGSAAGIASQPRLAEYPTGVFVCR